MTHNLILGPSFSCVVVKIDFFFSFDAQEPLDYSDVDAPTPTTDTNDNVQPLDDIDQADEAIIEKNVPNLRIGAEGTTAGSETIAPSTVIKFTI